MKTYAQTNSRIQQNATGKTNLRRIRTPWGKLYDQTISTLWRTRDEFVHDHQIEIERINPPGKHEPNEYYYLWLVYPAGRAQIPFEQEPDEELFDNAA
ncbi:MAG: hypothetical protein AAB849_02930 [Patescibacteria group bacterium]